MLESENRSKRIFQFIGICSPYFAVLVFVFLFKMGLFAVIFYHLVLLTCIISIQRANAVKLLLTGFHPLVTPLICLGGLVPGLVIYLIWPMVKMPSTDLTRTLEMLNLNKQVFLYFNIYACLVNPIMEESFWRGCFKNDPVFPNWIDLSFAGFHAVAVLPVVHPLFALFILLSMTFVGWLFRMLYRFTGGLLTSLLLHIIADIAILGAIWKIM